MMTRSFRSTIQGGLCGVLLLASFAATAQRAQSAEAPQEESFAARQAPGQMSDAERKLRMALLQRSMGFGGIFGPMIAPLNRPGAGGGPPRPAQKSCGAYSDYAACQAYRNGDRWAADRLQNKRSTGAERDWYNR